MDTAKMDGNRSVVLGEAIANSSSGGGVGGHESGSQENGMSFGLGVGFALSPELAQKVRECQGVSTAPAISSSSLTFLKGAPANGHSEPSSDGDAHASEGNAKTSDGDAGQSNGSIPSSGSQAGSSKSTEGVLWGAGSVQAGGVSSDHTAAGSERLKNNGALTADEGSRHTGSVAGNELDETQQKQDDSEGSIHESGADFQTSIEAAARSVTVCTSRQGDDDGTGIASREGHGSEVFSGECGGVGNPHKGDQGNGDDEEEGENETTEHNTDGESGIEELVSLPASADAPDSWEDFDESSIPDTPLRNPAHSGAAQPQQGGQQSEHDRTCGNDASVALKPSSGITSASEVFEEHAAAVAVAPAGKILVLQALPVLLVDLARVCGFRVKGAEQADAVATKIRAALHESFGERSEELFEMGSAVHADTSSLAEELSRRRNSSTTYSSWAVVDYPAKLEGVVVAEAWAALSTASPSAAVEAVRPALIGTGRQLAWKRDMLEQLKSVAANEGKERDARLEEERRKELDSWRERRREQLERLIEVRPMFERRRAMAEEKLIAASAASASSAGKAGGGNRSSPDPVSAAVVQSLDAKLETIDDLIARLEIEEGEEGHGFVPSDDDDGDEEEEDYYDDEMDYDAPDAGESNSEYFPDRDRGEPSRSTAGTDAAKPGVEGQRRQPHRPTARDSPHSTDDKTSAETKPAQKKKGKKKKKKGGRPGIVEQLKARGVRSDISGAVEAALEGEGDGGAPTSAQPPPPPPPPMSLLDAVAAMILGRYPQDPGATSEEHFEKIAAMHQHMKDAWMSEFGRLPPMTE